MVSITLPEIVASSCGEGCGAGCTAEGCEAGCAEEVSSDEAYALTFIICSAENESAANHNRYFFITINSLHAFFEQSITDYSPNVSIISYLAASYPPISRQWATLFVSIGQRIMRYSVADQHAGT